MCGKFTQRYAWRDVHAFLTHWANVTPLPPAVAEEVATATPMRFASVLHASGGERVVTAARWGFTDKAGRFPKHIHARGETAHQLPTFRDAFAHRRGVVMVETFNEGEEVPTRTGRMRTKQWIVRPHDARPLAIAVLCSEWPPESEERPAEFVMVTTPPNALIASITDRMPAMLTHNTLPLWLEGSPDEAREALATYEDGGAWAMAPQ